MPAPAFRNMQKFAAIAIALLLCPGLASAAIANDTSGSVAVGTSPRTLSYTASGSNIEMVVCAFIPGTTDTSTAGSFGATSLTEQTSALSNLAGDDYTIAVWAGPVTAGTANISVTTSSGNVGIIAATYTGDLGGINQATTTGVNYSGVNSLTLTYTPSTSNNWAVMCGGDGGSNPAAGTGAVLRQSGTPGGAALFDSNTTISSPFSMTYTWTGAGSAQNGNAVGVTLDPVAAGGATAPFSTNAAWWLLLQ